MLAFTEIGTAPLSPAPLVTGFTCISHVPRPHASSCGGVAIYVRTNLAPWARHTISHAKLGISMIEVAVPAFEPVHIIVCYLPHQTSNTWAEHGAESVEQARSEWYDTLQQCVERGSSGAVVLCGDFNSRTGGISETHDDDWAELAELGLPVPDTVLSYLGTLERMDARAARAHTDTTLNTWGKALLSFAKENQMVLTNGRLPGDPTGALTFLTANGSSTIEYLLVQPYLCFTQVGSPAPHCSLRVIPHATLPAKPTHDGSAASFDHAPVVLTFAIPRKQAVQRRVGERCSGFEWDASRQADYAKAILQDETVQVLLGRVLGAPEGSSRRAVHMLTHAVSTAASHCFRHKTCKKGPATQNKPWFDATCQHLRAIKLNVEHTHGRDSPEARLAATQYWARVRAARQAYTKAEMAKTVDLWLSNPQHFWKQYRASKSQTHDTFSLQDWTSYFERLYAHMGTHTFEGGSPDTHTSHHANIFTQPTDADTQHASCLNQPFTGKDVLTAIRALHNGKAAGTDGLPAELLKKAYHPDEPSSDNALLPEITRVMNLVFTGPYPQEWAVSALTAIPKPKGDLSNMDDYRGIAVGNALAKLYSTLLMQRMDAWAESHKHRAKGQAGFRRDRSAADNIFVLQHSIERARAHNQVVYCAFIDFQKAYDSVNRDLLWPALHSLGVHGAFLRGLQHMYANVEMRVKLEGRLGKAFAAPLGVKQGDPLSPLLFGLFIDRFERFVVQECPALGIHLTDTQIVSLLLYADDLVLMAHTPADLQTLLDVLHTFSVANHLTVNVKKSKVLACGAPEWGGHVLYGGKPLPTEQSFVYLGVRFFASYHDRGNAFLNMQSSLSKAKQALGAMRSRCRELGIHNVSILSRLFDSLVCSVLNYGCEMWGVYQVHDFARKGWGSNSACEQMHKTFLRCSFQVNSKTTCAVMMNEARRRPLVHSWCQRAVGWWNRVASRGDSDIAYIALRDSVSHVSTLVDKPLKCWALAFRRMVASIDPSMVVHIDRLEPLPITDVFTALEQKWSAHTWGAWRTLPDHTHLLRDTPENERSGFKLATYRHYFCSDSIDKGAAFIDHVHTPAQIKALARFRMSAHDLNIERMRHSRKKRHERYCTCCDLQCVEDELHIFECPAYSDVRNSFADLRPLAAPYINDKCLREFMNPVEPDKWPRLADFLLCVMAERTRILAPAVPA